jgi:CubicO group peptidase (beta-lactamase class C family)
MTFLPFIRVRLAGEHRSLPGVHFCLLPVLVLLMSMNCQAQSRTAEIDSLMRELNRRGQFNGAVLVTDHGHLLYKKGFGIADAALGTSFSTETPCYLASLSKQFTAMAIMMLAESHSLDYSDSLVKFIPEFPPYGRSVTIRQLLNHTSGIPDYVAMGLEHPGLTNHDVLTALLKCDSLLFPSGTRFGYSNSGYLLLALIIEKVSGEPYRLFLQRHIFDPLGMKHSFVRDSDSPTPAGLARGYARFGDVDDYDLRTYGEGGIYSSVEDLSIWDKALYTEKLVSSVTMAIAVTKPKLSNGSESNYGFGWVIGEVEGREIVSHAGRYGGFNTYIKRFLGDRSAVIFLTNHDYKNMSGIGNAIVNLLFHKPYNLPKLSVADSMYRLYRIRGIIPAVGFYRMLRSGNDTTFDFSEPELNELGYKLIGDHHYDDAVEILKLNTEAYPVSSNAYDGLGEAYLDNGNTEQAIVNYRKSLELDPGNHNAAAVLKKLGAR